MFSQPILLTICWSSLQSTETFGCFQFLGVLAGHLVLCIFPNALTYFASVFSQNLQAVSAHIILRLFLVRFKKSLQRLGSFMSPLDWSIPGKFAQYNAPNRTVVLSCFKFLVKIYFIVVLSLDVSDSRCPSDTHRWTSLWSNLHYQVLVTIISVWILIHRMSLNSLLSNQTISSA